MNYYVLAISPNGLGVAVACATRQEAEEEKERLKYSDACKVSMSRIPVTEAMAREWLISQGPSPLPCAALGRSVSTGELCVYNGGKGGMVGGNIRYSRRNPGRSMGKARSSRNFKWSQHATSQDVR